MAKSVKAPFKQPELASGGIIPFSSFWIQALVIVIFGAGVYWNSLDNEYALDDEIIIHKNEFVMNGFSGIGDIMDNDAYKSFYQSMGVEQQLSGGRYRPLSIVSFAVETQLFVNPFQPDPPPAGADEKKLQEHNEYQKKVKYVEHVKKENLRIAPIRHGFQIFYYVVSLLLLFYFLRNYIFRTNIDIAFIATMLFAAHPIHSEVVANVKSRDEIFSLLFVVLTLIFFFRYDLKKKTSDLVYAMIAFLLAMLSKEYAVVGVPAVAVAGVCIFHKRLFKKAVMTFLPLLLSLFVYIGMRYHAVGLASQPVNLETQDILNDPYLNLKSVGGAKPKEKGSIAASKINRLDDYVSLLVYPNPLSSDYSYRHFPYSKFNDPMVWLSLLIYIGLIYLTWILWMRRHPMAFALIFYLFFFVLIANVFMDIGATMGERLIYHSSVGFVIALAWGLGEGAEWLKKKEQPGPAIAAAVFLAILVLYSIKTWNRSADWKNDYTLFTRDVKYVPNSALTNGNAGARYMDKGIAFKDNPARHDSLMYYSKIAEGYLLHAVDINPKYVNSYLNLGLCYYYQKNYSLAAKAWSLADLYFNDHPLTNEYAKFFTNIAMPAAVRQNYDSASVFFGYAARTDPWTLVYWDNFGGTSFMATQFDTAAAAFQKGITYGNELKRRQLGKIQAGQASPQDTLATAQIVNKLMQGLGSANYFGGLKKQTIAQPDDYSVWFNYALACSKQPAFWTTADSSFARALHLKPGDPVVLKALAEFEASKKQPPPKP